MAEEEADVELRDILMKQRTILLGEINHKSVGDVVRRLLILQSRSADRINLLIDSEGGEITAAFKLCDTIECLITAPVRGIAIVSCKSAATFVLMHCDERIATPNADFLIHSGKMSGITVMLNHTTQTELEHLLAESKASTERMIRMYMQKLHKSRRETVLLFGRGDRRFNGTISAPEAVKLGLIQSIETRLNVFPKIIARGV